MSDYDYKAIDAVVNIWNEEALKQRPGWGDQFFQKKMKSTESTAKPIEIDESRIGGPDDVRALGIQRIADAGDAIQTRAGAEA